MKANVNIHVYVLFCCLRSKLILFCFNTGAFHWNCQTILDLQSFGYHFSVASTWFCLYFIDWKKKGVQISLNIYILFVSKLIFQYFFHLSMLTFWYILILSMFYAYYSLLKTKFVRRTIKRDYFLKNYLILTDID